MIPRELKKNLRPNAPVDEVKQVIRKAIVQANEEIMAMGALDRDLRNMGTTVVLAIWRMVCSVTSACCPRRGRSAARSTSITGSIRRITRPTS